MRPTWSLVLALQFARAEKSEASRCAYRSDFELFSRWRGEELESNILHPGDK
jgi:hypothetical protein